MISVQLCGFIFGAACNGLCMVYTVSSSVRASSIRQGQVAGVILPVDHRISKQAMIVRSPLLIIIL